MKISRLNMLGTFAFLACCSLLAGVHFANVHHQKEQVLIHKHRVEIPPSVFEDEQWKLIDRTGKIVADSSPNLKNWQNVWSQKLDQSWGHELRTKAAGTDRELIVELNPWSYKQPLIPVKRGQLWGFVDDSGKVAVEPIYEHVNDFSNGYALVQEPNEHRWEIVDRKGRVVRSLEPEFEPEEGVSTDGVLVMKKKQNGENDFYILDIKTGKSIPTPMIDRYRGKTFSEGLARYTDVSRKKLGYVDTKGKAITEPIYDEAGLFSEGLAAVFFANRFHFIDTKGRERFALPTDCSLAGDFHNGLAAVALGGHKAPSKFAYLQRVPKDAHWGFIDKTGKVAIPAKFNIEREPSDIVIAPDFHSGLCRMVDVASSTPSVGFIDIKGEWALPPSFAKASDFENNLARVCVNTPGFLKTKWISAGKPNYYSRQDLFTEFAKQFNLIGMFKDQVRLLLGAPTDSDGDIDTYSTNASSCGNGCESVEIRYMDDIVISYRYIHGDSRAAWISNIQDDVLNR
ncbi:MAG: WG repeat-containing protein [Cyanobacteria bacterium SZAS-4]|nr:WG repeat-containing protein [Cyanobacteria bacterium SZAS-4]